MHHRASAGRGDRVGTLAAVASVRQLVVVKAASQLSLFQMSGNVLIGHLLETSLEKVNFLILTPSPASTSRCLLSVLLNAEVVSVDGIDRRVVGLAHMG
jgi:hypothetical protein